ncbi:hypothetical protein KEM60_01226 [Austwickia sp. TVS 96-490-7B]|uniref:nitrate reductase molybdenum cofactor assembly chaperone n=1 Tax=Austwickia sp. TVS 96-490-7B TaxID=2830843 RepID=UPI001C5653BC|nr:nitrate reductase molybdenum cofactor assembly chaperone [Austwickia sp. TVS 96-490-7B]MBW3085034.1 hypothetical protein [Austwickia sp. TVS 96-490-7B]
MRLALRRRKSGQLPWDADTTAAVWQCASLLLGYPDETLMAQLSTIMQVTQQLPAAVGGPLGRLAADLSAADPQQVRRDYVSTFDYTRRCAPYVTYFSCGDTRKRGVALVKFKQAYRQAGVELSDADAELPDHLSVVLEFGASVDLTAGLGLVLEHRASVEVLRLALLDAGSRWADALVAVCATLPPLDGDERSAVARLIEEGPPAEDVGLAPYEIDPRLNPHPADDVSWASSASASSPAGSSPTFSVAVPSEGVRS